MSVEVEAMAARVAKRVDKNVGFDPVTIISLISAVLVPLLQCFGRNDEPDPVQVQAAVKERYERNPAALLRRTTRRVKMEAKAKGEALTQPQAVALAQAVIDEAMKGPKTIVAAFCAAHK